MQVKIWFQNRRTKWKKQDNISNAEAAEHKNQTNHKSGGLHQAQTKSGKQQSKDIEGSSDSNSSLLVSDGGNSVTDSNGSRGVTSPKRELVAGKGQPRIVLGKEPSDDDQRVSGKWSVVQGGYTPRY